MATRCSVGHSTNRVRESDLVARQAHTGRAEGSLGETASDVTDVGPHTTVPNWNTRVCGPLESKLAYVYVLNKAPHDYSDAERYGELFYCTTGPLDKLDLSQMYRELDRALEDSQPDDWILLTSLTSLCSVACSIFAIRHNRLNLLIHTREGYVDRSLYFPDFAEQP